MNEGKADDMMRACPLPILGLASAALPVLEYGLTSAFMYNVHVRIPDHDDRVAIVCRYTNLAIQDHAGSESSNIIICSTVMCKVEGTTQRHIQSEEVFKTST